MSEAKIVLIGTKSTGKTTVGAMLARRLGVTFIDTDDAIERVYESRYAKRLGFRGIYAELGADEFRKLEFEAVTLALGSEAGVIALGGGALENLIARGRSDLLSAMRLIELTVDKDTLFDRMTVGGIPPFLDRSNLRASFDELYDRRRAQNRGLASLTVENGTRPASDTVDFIARELERERGRDRGGRSFGR